MVESAFAALYQEKMMKPKRFAKGSARGSANGSAKSSFVALAGAASLALLALGASTAAHARDVCWSVGLSSAGVQLGVFSPQPVYAQPQVIYAQPQVIYTQPQIVYTQPRPVYVQPAPVYVQPRPVYVQPQPVVVYNGWHQPRHGGRHGPWPYSHQYVQSYPAQYQALDAAYGHGQRQR